MDLSATIHLLGDVLGDVLAEQETRALFEVEESIRGLAKARRAGDRAAASALAREVGRLSPDAARVVAAAFTVYFDLVNLAEERHRVRELRRRERERHPGPVAESIPDAVASLRARGVTAEQIARLLEDLHVELVLTAHPTEAKRRTVLAKLQRIGETLGALDAPDLLPRERQALVASLRTEVTGLWLTDRARTTRPAVTDEVRTALYFVDTVFWDALPRLHDELDRALEIHYPGLRAPRGWLTLASWIGGDRDGNPNVTAEVTAETLRLHRGLAVERHRRALQELARRLSVSARRVPLPEPLRAWLERGRPLPPHAAYVEARYRDEPYRLVLVLLAGDLEAASRDDMAARLRDDAAHRALVSVAELAKPLELVAAALPEALADGIRSVCRQLDVFGLQGARLDVREDARRLGRVLAELLAAHRGAPPPGRVAPGAGTSESLESPSMTPEDRTARLAGLLADTTRLPAPDAAMLTPETAETWALFRLLARARAVYGRALFGAFVISMAQSADDVLTVLALARWAGCDDGLAIAPLFETVDDLDAAPRVLAELFALDVYRRHLATCAGEQVVMVGYSDSNKDGGYLAANWALWTAQETVARVCREHGVRLTLFHGRGGSVARGGGPANRAIRAQPPGTIAGRFRVTEQGETIAARYADPHLAHRHLEQIVHAVLLASVPGGAEPEVRPSWRDAMERMADAARAAYRSLVWQTPRFAEYWHAATPIDELGRLRLGSRPAARRAGGIDLEHVRAIPWVFSWMQSRFNLPGWYGLGAGLTAAGVDVDTQREMFAGWPFFRALLDNAEMSLLKADMEIAALYSALVPDRALAERVFTRIADEYERTRTAVMRVTSRAALMDDDRVIQRSIELRNPYVDPLNYVQVETLRRLRELPDPDGAQAEPLREVIAITINGIAAGLRNTG
jgi:phosphoenolpyruvate carboxylase